MEKRCVEAGVPCVEGSVRPGYAYVPIQSVKRYYDYGSAMVCGTIFPELCIPKGKYGPKEDAQK